jgi:hypothetical protein
VGTSEKVGLDRLSTACSVLAMGKLVALPMTLKEAQKEYTPCSVCKPPQ